MKKISILGSTGSIGVSALNVIKNFPEKFRIIHLTGNLNSDKMIKQGKEFLPKTITMIDEKAAEASMIESCISREREANRAFRQTLEERDTSLRAQAEEAANQRRDMETERCRLDVLAEQLTSRQHDLEQAEVQLTQKQEQLDHRDVQLDREQFQVS